MTSSATGFLRTAYESVGFKWLVCAICLLLAAVIMIPGFFLTSFLSHYEIRGMNSTYATVVETNVQLPEDSPVTPAIRHRWEQNATLVEFTAGGAQRSAMVSTLPRSSQGTSVLIWYNATTFGGAMLDSDRNFPNPQQSMLVAGLISLSVGIWMIIYDRKAKSGKLKPLKKAGLGGGRHAGRS